MKDAMTYKGYIGLVRYSAADEVFHGKIDAINELIMFEGARERPGAQKGFPRSC